MLSVLPVQSHFFVILHLQQNLTKFWDTYWKLSFSPKLSIYDSVLSQGRKSTLFQKPRIALLLFGAQLKASYPQYVLSALEQTAPFYAIGSATRDEQFKQGDDLSFLWTSCCRAVWQCNSKWNWAAVFKQEGKSILQEVQWVLYFIPSLAQPACIRT